MFVRAVVVVLCVLVVISDGARSPNCSKYPLNSRLCPKIYRPLCATNRVTYGNECLLCDIVRRVRIEIKIQHEGECKTKPHRD